MSIKQLDARANKEASSKDILDTVKYELALISGLAVGIVCLRLIIG